MMLFHLITSPFSEFGFMRRALVGCLVLTLSAAPLGCFLLLRRMSLIGDALSHAVLPGVAIGYLISGMSLLAMGIGGFIAGLSVAMLSGFVTRHTELKEDASFAGFYLGSLALGVTLVSLRGSNIDLLHVLFGSILAVDRAALIDIALIGSASLLVLAVIYRALVIESFDVTFLRISSGRYRALIHGLFLSLVVLNLVAGFQLLGTLMTVGMMMLPAASARFWTQRLPVMLGIAVLQGMVASLIGLLWSYYAELPAGPAIILTMTLFFCFSVCVGHHGGLLRLRR
ncbi:metal ABC transporter permease [Pectobacterium atrosepticum]|uniref:metal ABC transporter permease n=1 Tax=Pectobacterium atrosepticum TaxID=29471 RepID=UPI00039E7B8F|nr:metal ABC transporter permease [Pectobacterium atrosepticum]GKV86846.1 iron ABC transporter [Pectobacterium carotovorum subsp. carotovorum]ATY92223.1 metal ABC transporter permease [Pectobacterium atrosepticum]KFX24530.1 iron ABC transporter [Pectobacterium atrosepticum]MBL0894141.1 metal ABC transporter permease [Pectobacterium atrosepticum]MCA6978243.1 metal ABC transporter permease [Pectobacterium atrosepticum]